MDVLCGLRVVSEDRIQYILQPELPGPAPKKEGSGDSGEECLFAMLSGAVPLQMWCVPPWDTPWDTPDF